MASPLYHIFTDSCLTGCGGISDTRFYHSLFPPFVQDQDIPIYGFELMTVVVVAKLWDHQFTGLKVKVNCHNQAVAVIIYNSKTKDSFVSTCLRELWFSVSRYNSELVAVY